MRNGVAEYQVDYRWPHLDGLLGDRWGYWEDVGFAWKTLEEAQNYIRRRLGRDVVRHEVVKEIAV